MVLSMVSFSPVGGQMFSPLAARPMSPTAARYFPGWDTSETLTWFSTGRLSIWRTIREHPLGRFELDGPGLYRVRAHTGDRHQIWQAADRASHRIDEGSGPGPVRGAERFLIRFWPAPPSDMRDMVEAPGSVYPEQSEQSAFAQAIRIIGTSDFSDVIGRTERATRVRASTRSEKTDRAALSLFDAGDSPKQPCSLPHRQVADPTGRSRCQSTAIHGHPQSAGRANTQG